MKMQYFFIALIFLLSSVFVYSQSNQPGNHLEQKINPTRLVVKFKGESNTYKMLRKNSPLNYHDELVTENIKTNNESLSLLENLNVISVKPAKPTTDLTPLPGGIERIFFLNFINEDDLQSALNVLNESDEVEYVEYDYIGYGGGVKVLIPFNSVNEESMIIPNDPYFQQQWGFRNTGQVINGVTGEPGADINMTPGWDITTGNSNQIISVLDSGIPNSTTDFQGRVLQGYDFANDDNDPLDDLGHGTNVSSIIAAKGNNNNCVAGMNWNTKILPLKILNSSNFGYYSWWISAMVMAADSNAKVLNMSVGGSDYSSGLYDAANYVHQKGAVITACMMNTDNNVLYYPAGFNDFVFAIGATNNLDDRVEPFCWGGGSNYGSNIDFVAPGEMILGIDFNNPNSGVTYWCGTSQATPMVCALVSLMFGLNPSLTFSQIYDKIKQHCKDQIGNPAEDTPGWDQYYGYGKIDVTATLQDITAVDEENNPVVKNFNLFQNYPNPFNPNTVISYQLSVNSMVTIKIYDIIGNEVATLVNEDKPAGVYEVEFDASRLTSGVYFYKLKAGSFVDTKKMILLR